MSYRAEVIADASEQWAGNALRFATEEEAQAYASDLYARWTLVRSTRVVLADEPVNATWREGRMHYQPEGTHEDACGAVKQP